MFTDLLAKQHLAHCACFWVLLHFRKDMENWQNVRRGQIGMVKSLEFRLLEDPLKDLRKLSLDKNH